MNKLLTLFSFLRGNRYGRVRLDSIPELPLEASTTGLQNLQTFSVSELKPPEEGVEETVVYFNTDSGLGIGIGGLEEVTNMVDGVTIQAIGKISAPDFNNNSTSYY